MAKKTMDNYILQYFLNDPSHYKLRPRPTRESAREKKNDQSKRPDNGEYQWGLNNERRAPSSVLLA